MLLVPSLALLRCNFTLWEQDICGVRRGRSPACGLPGSVAAGWALRSHKADVWARETCAGPGEAAEGR